MTIDEIKLTKEEMNEAVQNYLDFRNVKVTVTGVDTYGYPIKGWRIALETEPLSKTETAISTESKPFVENV